MNLPTAPALSEREIHLRIFNKFDRSLRAWCYLRRKRLGVTAIIECRHIGVKERDTDLTTPSVALTKGSIGTPFESRALLILYVDKIDDITIRTDCIARCRPGHILRNSLSKVKAETKNRDIPSTESESTRKGRVWLLIEVDFSVK